MAAESTMSYKEKLWSITDLFRYYRMFNKRLQITLSKITKQLIDTTEFEETIVDLQAAMARLLNDE